MNFEMLDRLLNASSQKFICEAAGGRHGVQEKEIDVIHEVTPGLKGAELEKYESVLGDLESLKILLSKYGSLRLYCDTNEKGSAFYIAHPEEWSEMKDDLATWLDDLDEQEKCEMVPDWIDDALVFGEAPESGNFYLLPMSGEFKGAVFEFEHDGFVFQKVASDLYEFLNYVCSVNADLITLIRSHTRYFDGITNIQWIPKTYCCKDEGQNMVIINHEEENQNREIVGR